MVHSKPKYGSDGNDGTHLRAYGCELVADEVACLHVMVDVVQQHTPLPWPTSPLPAGSPVLW
jgi:hypothetical protein